MSPNLISIKLGDICLHLAVRVADLQDGEQFDRAGRGFAQGLLAADDLCGAAANLQPAGVHRGQFARQTVQQYDAPVVPEACLRRDAATNSYGPRRAASALPFGHNPKDPPIPITRPV